MTRRQLTDRRALVTGASSGIGRALAIELARQGVDLVLLARREERLAEVAEQVARLGRRAVVVVGDVTDPVARLNALESARDQLGGLDILINNAGISAHGRFADADPGRLRPIMEVNFFAPVELIRESLPLLRAGRQPIVVNIGSVLGKRGCPHKSEYSASKFALQGFGEALRAEFARLGIDVLTVAAGPTDTEFFQHLIEEHGELPWKESQPVSPERVARATVRAMERGRHEIIPSWRGWLLVTANRWFPWVIDRIMARYG
ncbi:MAG: SDR family oxidoreductase [Planctomycetes bacterium]|nr:SDR family oxidoreductase [Planctomycetota bacterium]